MRKIFIDAGAYNGDTVKLFLEQYPEADQFEIFYFEPNPNFKKQLESLQSEKRIFIPKAVWVDDTTMKFYLDSNNLGSTLMRSKCSRSNLDKDNPIEVEAIDLSNWIKKNFSIDDFIVLKMDIEGAEYTVLNKMIEDRTIHYIKEIYIDWHGRKLAYFNKKIHHKLLNFLKENKLHPGYFCGETWKIKR